MESKELYEHILGLENPWSVSKVHVDTENGKIVVDVRHPRGVQFYCPDCDQSLGCYDHASEREWRHLDSCQFKTILRASIPRVNCPQHGVKQVRVPWAEANSRFTILFEAFAIELLQVTQTVTGAKSVLRISWDQTWNIILRAVRRGQRRKKPVAMPRVGIDEKSFSKGHSYMTLLYDLDNSTVEAIAEGKDEDAANACFSELSREQVDGIQAIGMDMSSAFVKSAKANIPLAEDKIVHDRFHVMKLANEAVDKVRRREHRRLKQENDHRLTGTKYLWLKGQENLSEKQASQFAAVYSQQLDTSKAWGYKEILRDVWNHDTPEEATTFFKEWYRSVIHTKLEPMKKVARTINERLPNVVSYCKHEITNAVAEGINSKIQSIKRRVGGYRNKENFKTAIFFYCGGLDLLPK